MVVMAVPYIRGFLDGQTPPKDLNTSRHHETSLVGENGWVFPTVSSDTRSKQNDEMFGFTKVSKGITSKGMARTTDESRPMRYTNIRNGRTRSGKAIRARQIMECHVCGLCYAAMFC